MKICTICHVEKELSEFIQDKSAKGGYRNQCKACRRAIQAAAKENYAERREGYNRSMRKFRGTVKGAIQTSLHASKQRCKKSGVPFDLDLEYVTELFHSQGGLCALTQQEMIPKTGRQSPSLDRMTPELGYVKGNVQWVTWRANAIKQDMDMDELYAFCETVLSLRC